MKIDGNGYVTEIEESDIVDGTLVITGDNVKGIAAFLIDNSRKNFGMQSDELLLLTEEEMKERENGFPNNIKRIIISNKVEAIGHTAFRGCTGVQEVDFEENSILTKVDVNAFQDCSSLTGIELPESLEIVGEDAFRGCNSIEVLTIPENAAIEIGEKSFEGCTKLKELHILGEALKPEPIGEGVGYIRPGAGAAATPIREITEDFRNSITNNGSNRLVVITLPKGIESIGNFVFKKESSLKKVTIQEGVITIGAFAFDHCSSLEEITIPDSVTDIYVGAFVYCTSLKEITVPKNVTTVSSIICGACTSLTKVNLPEGIEEIQRLAFSDCTSLKEINIPKNVKIIEICAFAKTNIKKIELPEGITFFDEQAGVESEELRHIEIILPKSLQELGEQLQKISHYTVIYKEPYVITEKEVGSSCLEGTSIDKRDHAKKQISNEIAQTEIDPNEAENKID